MAEIACTTPGCERPPVDTWGPTGQRYCHAWYMKLWRNKEEVPSSERHLAMVPEKLRACWCGKPTMGVRFECWEDSDEFLVLKEHLMHDGNFFRREYREDDYAPWCGSEKCAMEYDCTDEVGYLRARVYWLEFVLDGVQTGMVRRSDLPQIRRTVRTDAA